MTEERQEAPTVGGNPFPDGWYPARYFSEFAGSDSAAWNHLVGARIRHRSPKLGEGVVQGVETPDGGPRLVVTFPSLDPGEATKRFTADALGPHLEWLRLGNQPAGFEEHVAKARADELELRRLTEERLKEERAHREREQAALAEFKGLRRQFGIEGCTDTSVTSPVYAALLHLREGKVVGDEIASALESVGYWTELARVYEIQFGLTGDMWDLVKAASTFRKATAPRRALKVLADARSDDPRLQAAMLTTQGAAYRDLGDLDSAERLAREAMKVEPKSAYGANLLGGIYYDRGQPDRGDAYFEQALSLGASEAAVTGARRLALSRSKGEVQRTVARHLVELDRDKYSWAQKWC